MRQDEALTASNFSLPAGESQPLKKARGRPRGSKKKVDKELIESMERKTIHLAEPINPSGIWPTEFKVLIRPDDAEEEITHGSLRLIKPIDQQEKEKQASQCGVIIAVSPLAFSYETWPEGASPPRVGQKAIYAKYAGYKRKGRDGVEYVLMNDRDIAATFEG